MYDTYADVAPEYYGQATDSGTFDDVETFGPEEVFSGVRSAATSAPGKVAWLIIVAALAFLWLMGAGLFKGSNHS